jgi:hypothetical protein
MFGICGSLYESANNFFLQLSAHNEILDEEWRCTHHDDIVDKMIDEIITNPLHALVLESEKRETKLIVFPET